MRIRMREEEIILEPGDRLDLAANVVHSADVVGEEVVVNRRVLSPNYPDVLRSFRRRGPADSAVGSSAPPGSHSAPPVVARHA